MIAEENVARFAYAVCLLFLFADFQTRAVLCAPHALVQGHKALPSQSHRAVQVALETF
jgi:hypothetical protein